MAHALEGAEIAFKSGAEDDAAREEYGAAANAMRERLLREPLEALPPELRAIAIAMRDDAEAFEIERERRTVLQGRYQRRKANDLQGSGGKVPDVPAGQGGPVPLLKTFDAYAAERQIKPTVVREWRAIIAKLVEFLGHDDAKRITLDDLAHRAFNLAHTR